MRKKQSIVIIILLLSSTVSFTVITGNHNPNESQKQKIPTTITPDIPTTFFAREKTNQHNLTFDLKIREKNKEWTDENITTYIGSIIEFQISITTNRGYPLSLSAVVSFPTTEDGSLFEFIKNSEYSSKKTTMFNATDEDILFLWIPLLRPTSITCTFEMKVKNTCESENIQGAGIGIINDDNADIRNDTITITSKIPPIPETPAKPVGPDSGYIHESYAFTSSTIDPYNQSLFYQFSWGDGTNSEWIGPQSPGTLTVGRHSWNHTGTYSVRVKAKNEAGFQSSWSEPQYINIAEKIKIITPQKGIYIQGSKLINFPTTIIIGEIIVNVTTPGIQQVESIEYYVNDKQQKIIYTKPYTWTWDEPMFGKYTLDVIVNDNTENSEKASNQGFKIV